ncbi:MAG TPA: GAF domain-containing protein [Actinomycetes bacterium]|nr:GAF domain-containing protein [Actinomycetes bacterium]
MPSRKPGRRQPPDPYLYRRAWSANTRDAASKRIRTVLDEASGLIPVAEAMGEAFLDIMVASAVSISLLDEDGYRDLVNVGKLGQGEVRFPNERYPISLYPAAAARLLARQGYISADGTLDLDADHPHLSAWAGVGCFMGVPIVAGAEVRGEVLMVRGKNNPVFSAEDLEVAGDLATQFGARLPELLNTEPPP